MELHSITNVKGAVRRKKRLGCGESSGHGKTSGKGNKGQMARSGHKRKPMFEGGQMKMIRRIPKRGFNNPVKVMYAPVNLSRLEGFADGADIGGEELFAAGLIRKPDAPVKILGQGDLSKKLTVKAHKFSESARSKIEAAGGSCVIVN